MYIMEVECFMVGMLAQQLCNNAFLLVRFVLLEYYNKYLARRKQKPEFFLGVGRMFATYKLFEVRWAHCNM